MKINMRAVRRIAGLAVMATVSVMVACASFGDATSIACSVANVTASGSVDRHSYSYDIDCGDPQLKGRVSAAWGNNQASERIVNSRGEARVKWVNCPTDPWISHDPNLTCTRDKASMTYDNSVITSVDIPARPYTAVSLTGAARDQLNRALQESLRATPPPTPKPTPKPIQVADRIGTGPGTRITDFLPPSKPANLTGQSLFMGTKYVLQWTDASLETRYELKGVNASTNAVLMTKTLAADAVAYVDDEAPKARVNTRYELRACNSRGCSDPVVVTINR